MQSNFAVAPFGPNRSLTKSSSTMLLLLFCSVLCNSLLLPKVQAADPKSVITGDNPQQRLQSTELLYPTSLSELADITLNKSLFEQPLPFRLPFFGFSYNYIWIQRDGHIAFNQGLSSYRFPVKFPILPQKNSNEGIDPSLIAPFFARQGISPDVTNAGVYLRVVKLDYSSESKSNITQRIHDDFRDGMVGASDFRPKFAIIVTWKNMTLQNKASTDSELKTNTYQVVLATDEVRTYAMFNYETIDDRTQQLPAYVGFNAGNSTRTFEFSPYSQNYQISKLTSHGFGNGLKGRYFFQIDEEIWSGTCAETDLVLPGSQFALTFFPRVGSMLGGTMVNITGPCLEPNSVITCQFENWETKGVYRDRNRASCITPPVIYNGYVQLTVRVDNQIYFRGQFYIQPPDTTAQDDIVIFDDTDRQEKPREMKIKWRPERLSAWNLNTEAQISLWGYRESDEGYPHLTYIATLVDRVELGQSKLELDLTQLRVNPDISDIVLGFIQINLTNPKVLGDFDRSPAIWSRAMPLSWYFKSQWERENGTDKKWKTNFCTNWYKQESKLDNLATIVARCPCTLQQAELDRGRYSPDSECNVVDRKCNSFHQGAIQCVKTGRPSIEGSGQTCCYDDYGELLQTADTMYGGRPSRSSGQGKYPFKGSMKIPVLSEYLHDTVPFLFCCKWQPTEDNSESCELYTNWRTSQDCSSYQAPAIASVYGDPHILTFDRVNYTFNGKGEFTLVHVDNPQHKFELQGRFEPASNLQPTSPSLNATVLTAIVAASNISSIVEFRVRPIAASWRYQLYVIVDKEYIYWREQSSRMQSLRGVTLYQPAGIQNMSHIVAQFDSGVGVEVMVNRGHMTVHVYAPDTFLKSTRGLLGNYSRQIWDEFTLPEKDSYLPITSSSSDIYQSFVQNYRVKERVNSNDINLVSSLFYHNSVPYSYYENQANFEPEFDPTLPDYAKHLQSDMESVCADSFNCRYDYILTLDHNYAKVTREEESFAQWLANEAHKKFIRCPALPKPINGHKSDNRYWPGVIVRFSCDTGYLLIGNQTKRCSSDGQWSPAVTYHPQCIKNSNTKTKYEF